ncbi:hypothetical protein CHS0354_040881 [Potamilus streckersoni]|uniref:GH18 domain-containing protein n=1 Tax=Potamilus streckersoni TaxID=2493646 RepID=A0AAE0SLE7_9BIVA|nr:hypothetical protein CHS0354_040881 [Potamilus streckersoni]
MWWWVLKWLLLASMLQVAKQQVKKVCPCDTHEKCLPVNDMPDYDREIFIVTERKSDYMQWMWESVTTVVTTGFHWQELMCYAHAKSNKYGFIELVPDELNTSKAEFQIWLQNVTDKVQDYFADVVVFDFTKLLGNCEYAEEHVEDLLTVTHTIINSTRNLKRQVKVSCVMPWMPPCFGKECSYINNINGYCDTIILNPESYLTYCSGLTCTAQATVPLSKLITGIDEYVAAGWEEKKIIMGIPWHGYKFKCKSYRNSTFGRGICELPKIMAGNITTGKCDFENSKEKMSLGIIHQQNPNWLMADRSYDMVYSAPYHVLRNQSNNSDVYQVWFEDMDSLTAKYKIVDQFKLKGLIVYSGDDLSYTKVNIDTVFNTGMWAWMLHSVLSTGTENVYKSNIYLNYPAKIAGIGVGMFFLGFVLSFIIACIVFRKKKLKKPFQKDLKDTTQDEYFDEDNTL